MNFQVSKRSFEKRAIPFSSSPILPLCDRRGERPSSMSAQRHTEPQVFSKNFSKNFLPYAHGAPCIHTVYTRCVCRARSSPADSQSRRGGLLISPPDFPLIAQNRTEFRRPFTGSGRSISGETIRTSAQSSHQPAASRPSQHPRQKTATNRSRISFGRLPQRSPACSGHLF